MAIRNTLLGGASNWSDGQVIYGADINDTFDATVTRANKALALAKWKPLSNSTSSFTVASLLWFDADTLVMMRNTGSTSERSTDAGASWSSVSTVVGANYATRVSDSSTHAIGWDPSSTTVAYTSNAGSSWTAGTMTAGFTSVRVIRAPTTTVAVCAGVPSAGIAVAYSTNNGSTWSKSSTGPTVAVHALGMYNASVGFLIDSSNNIWKTTNGGVNWTDTGVNDPSGLATDIGGCVLFPVSDTSFIYRDENGPLRYFNGSGVTYVIPSMYQTTNNGAVLQPYRLANGYIYLGGFNYGTGFSGGGALYRSKDNGLRWEIFPINISVATTTSPTTWDYHGNRLALAISGTTSIVMFLDESEE